MAHFSDVDRIQLDVQKACIWEATARKVGNVHRFADYSDLNYVDFLMSAAAVAPILTRAGKRPLGETILNAVRATRELSATNVNLGIILLLAPLCVVQDRPLSEGVQQVIDATTISDARLVYEAIRLAEPGGLGDAPEQDVREEPTATLADVMRLAAERDLIASQFASGYSDVFDVAAPLLQQGFDHHGNIEQTILYCQMQLLAQLPDTLIARKYGLREAENVRRRAAAVIDGTESVTAFDQWLRDRNHRRNPGAIADLIAASLFACLREDKIPELAAAPWSCPNPWDLRMKR